jgi:hypothetical protein
MLDGFSGYNQVAVTEEDRLKTAFVTPWGTYSYVCMPIGLNNVGEMFQREVNHAFNDLIGNFMVAYPYELTVDSKLREGNFKDLRQVFE